MRRDLYRKLTDLSVLRRGWHLARDDARDDFLPDSYRYSDFASSLDENLRAISNALITNSYHSKPLQTIDVPKSSLAVRPGSVPEIEDRIVTCAIAWLIAPVLDFKIPDGVYSYRVNKNIDRGGLFRELKLLEFPFLKRETIARELEVVEPWYEAWPNFIEIQQSAYEREGYRYLVISDIAAYFEHIDLGLLRSLLIRYLPQQGRLVNFLIGILDCWTWPAVEGVPAPRGIPQGNDVSSFLGNIYLLPLDYAFKTFSHRREIRYFRYMDDIKVFAKDMQTAREALFLMNENLRSLRLTIQGVKTQILRDEEIKDELFDNRLKDVNEIVHEIQTQRRLSPQQRLDYIARLKPHVKHVKGRREMIRDRELRLYRRIITGFTLLRHSYMVTSVLDQLSRNPDSRLLRTVLRYLRVQTQNQLSIPNRLIQILAKREELFPFQEAHLFNGLRYARNIPESAWQLASQAFRDKSRHWFVRVQAARLFSLKPMCRRDLTCLRHLFDRERDIEIRRALILGLSQLPTDELEEFIRKLMLSPVLKLQRIGQFYFSLNIDKTQERRCIESLFREFQEEAILDRLHELEIISKSNNLQVVAHLKDCINRSRSEIRRTWLINRVNRLLRFINERLPG